jgi:hypothetical protein
MSPLPELTRTPEAFAPLVEMAAASIHREYPYHVLHVVTRDADVAPHRELTPAFMGSFDWHSAVHGHWCLARAVRTFPHAPWATKARLALSVTLTEQRLAGELRFLSRDGQGRFELPYGMAWLLQLASELRGWDDPSARQWSAWLQPLEQQAAVRMTGYLDRLPYPVRGGEHSQTAFAAGLFMDWARDSGQGDLVARIAERVVRLYAGDRDAPVRYEPSGYDFLSPVLAEADLMRRAMDGASFANWLTRFLPAADAPGMSVWLRPVVSPDPSDGKLSHLDGLNLSRAWMLRGVLDALPEGHAHKPMLLQAEMSHRSAGLEGARTQHYAGSHWLGSFAMYLLTDRGLET